MLQSMTGYGEAQYEGDGISLFLEIKALNNRFLKTVVKLPDPLSFAEPSIEKMIREHLNRGSITYIMHMHYLGEAGPFDVNHAALQNYLQHLEQISTLHHNDKLQIDLASLLQLPGVCQLRKYSEDEHKALLEIVTVMTREGLDRLRLMRAEEGRSIGEDLMKNCRIIHSHLEELSKLSGEAVKSYRIRLEKRVNELLSGSNYKLDEETLIKEVALFAERCDINEEITRLQSHLDQFRDACENANHEQTGRRLDFLTQELLREANTIASKANHARISHHVVEIKVAIDRLKEQVQNIE